jgi:co-chaperonin GroES (HSP10)
MSLGIEKQSLNNLIMIGDRVLIQHKSPQEKTKSGLYLPPGMQEKEKIYSSATHSHTNAI